MSAPRQDSQRRAFPLPLAVAATLVGLAGGPFTFVVVAALAVAYGCTGTARPGSVIAAAGRLRVWLVTTSLAALLAGALLAGLPPCPGCPRAATSLCLALSAGAIALLTVADALRLLRVGQVTRGLMRVAHGDRTPAAAQHELDLGVGHDSWVSAAYGAAYRDRVRRRGVTGCVRTAVRRLAGAVAVDALMLAGSAAILVESVSPKVHVCGIRVTATSAQALRSATETWRSEHPDEPCPTAETLVRDHAIDAASKLTDAWDDPYVITCAADETYVSSWGPDGKDNHGFGDDVRVPARKSWSAP